MISEHIAPTRLHIVVVAAPLAALTLLMIRPSRWLNRTAAKVRAGPKQQALIFAIGVWLGLIVLDGATCLLFALVLAVGRDLTEANAAKAALLTVSAAGSLPGSRRRPLRRLGPRGGVVHGRVCRRSGRRPDCQAPSGSPVGLSPDRRDHRRVSSELQI